MYLWSFLFSWLQMRVETPAPRWAVRSCCRLIWRHISLMMTMVPDATTHMDDVRAIDSFPGVLFSLTTRWQSFISVFSFDLDSLKLPISCLWWHLQKSSVAAVERQTPVCCYRCWMCTALSYWHMLQNSPHRIPLSCMLKMNHRSIRCCLKLQFFILLALDSLD